MDSRNDNRLIPASLELDKEEFTNLFSNVEAIGKGASGRVYKSKRGNEWVAVKENCV